MPARSTINARTGRGNAAQRGTINNPVLAGNNPPDNVSCQGWEQDTVRVGWRDVDTDEVNYRIERSIDGGSFSEIATVSPNGSGNYDAYSDTGIDITRDYRYRIRGAHGDGTFTGYSAICDNPRITETGGFRIFYGLQGLDNCPQISDVCGASPRQTCLTDTSAGGNNVFVTLQTNALEGSADAFARVGFDRDAAVPSNSLDKIPVNVTWCDCGGCAGGSSLGPDRMRRAPNTAGPSSR